MVRFYGIAIKSDHGNGVEGNRNNFPVVVNVLVDANGPVGWYTDGGPIFSNVVVINRSSAAGAGGIITSYEGLINNTTIYMPNAGTNATCFLMVNTNFDFADVAGSGASPLVNNSLFYGCPNTFAVGTTYAGVFTPGANQFSNATDQPNSSSSPTFTSALGATLGGDNNTGFAPMGVSATACGGSPCYSLPFSSVFRSTSDLRLKVTSPTIGAGASFTLSPHDTFGRTFLFPSVVSNATDLFGNARP